jgi:hypothetical protein
MRSAPFGTDDKHPLKTKITNGGGNCTTNEDCGGINQSGNSSDEGGNRRNRGVCVHGEFSTGFFNQDVHGSRCKCNDGSTGPYCLADMKFDDELGAMALKNKNSLLDTFSWPALPTGFLATISCLFIATITVGFVHTSRIQKEISEMNSSYKQVPLQE